MAGDWIKFAHTTPDKPEIWRMAQILGITPEEVVGRLLRVWIWVDQQSLNGHAISVTEITIDSIARRDGFASAMISAGWLAKNGDGITFPNFERHNGETAKKRALAVDRKKAQREKEREIVTPLSRHERDESVTRDREEISSTTVRMSTDWQPDQEALTSHLSMMGVPHSGIPPDAIGEFKSYWSAQDRKHTQAQWTQKLAKGIKRAIEQSKGGSHGGNRKSGSRGANASTTKAFWETLFSETA